MRAWLTTFAIAFFLTATASSAAPIKPIQWMPDRAFARVVKVGFEAANKGVTVTADVCLRPRLPKHVALTAGLAEEDCLVVARGSKSPVCFELVWQSGPTGTRYSCALVKKALRDDVKPGWIVRYPAAFTA